MVISHILLAMNANRMYNLTNVKQKKSTEKLSSGYRINRAADDAAGLAISEKMRRQIRGLMQASLNCQDGISMVQTAAESLIRDTDMATEMVSNSNSNILAQVGQSMLAQANQSKQGIMTLLQ